jgi:hypothetical protein
MTAQISIDLAVSLRRTTQHTQPPRYRVAWDDQTSEFGGKCRTQWPGYRGPNNPPAIFRFAPHAEPTTERVGDYRVNIEAWKDFFMQINDDTTGQEFEYWTRADKSQFNQQGWPMMQYLVFSDGELKGQRIGNWFKFETLKPGDVARAQGMTIESHPWLIHKFTCVSFRNGQTVHIESTGTPRGVVYTPVITKEGWGFIPWRNVVAE